MNFLSKVSAGLLLSGVMGAAMADPVTLDLLTDNFGGETSFEMVQDPGGANVIIPPTPALGPLASNTNFQFDWDLPPGNYEFTIFDSFGDGICCGFGNGGFTLTTPTEAIPSPSGGQFGASETIAFSIAAPVPTLSEWAMILTTLLLGGIAIRAMVRRPGQA